MMLESPQDFCTGGPQAILIYKFSCGVRHAANTLYSPLCIIFLKKELFPGFKSFRLHKTSRQGRLYGNMDTSYLSGRSCFTGLKAVARWVLKNAWCDQFPSVKWEIQIFMSNVLISKYLQLTKQNQLEGQVWSVDSQFSAFAIYDEKAKWTSLKILSHPSTLLSSKALTLKMINLVFLFFTFKAFN